ncbi:MAG: hypothetical protein WCF84_26955 [Anaerolineae bacterium]
MEALLATAGLLLVIGLALVLLSRVWVGSSRLGGYGNSQRDDGPEPGARAQEDDDVRWNWKGDDRTPRGPS